MSGARQVCLTCVTRGVLIFILFFILIAVSMEEASGVVGPQEGIDAAEQPETGMLFVGARYMGSCAPLAPVDAAAQAPAPVDPPAEP